MITFKHKFNTKQVNIRTTRNIAERMSPWLQGVFGIKNPIVGFKVGQNKYYDAETFYSSMDKFYRQTVDIIQANDQLQISFVSDNLNSSLNIRNVPNPLFVEDFNEEPEEPYRAINDSKELLRRSHSKNDLIVVFNIAQVYKKQIVESINSIKSHQSLKVHFYIRILNSRNSQQHSYSIYIGNKLVATLNLTREYKENILMVIERFSKRSKNLSAKQERQFENEQQLFRASFEQQNEAPSFTTYQLQERLNQQACHDYLNRMYQQKWLKKYEYLKLNEKCQENFVEFYRIFCEGAIDNDYDNFKNEILLKVDNNLELLLSNVDEMDLSRPISREEQRKQNLKKSVSNIEIVKVENYFQILDQLKPLLSPKTVSLVKSQLLDENDTVSQGFADYLSRKISKQELANYLENALNRKQGRPVSRCLPRSANRNKQFNYNSQDEILPVPPTNPRPTSMNNVGINNFNEEHQTFKNQEAQLIQLMSANDNSKEPPKGEVKQTPPMFGSSKEQNNFSPIKYMSDIESNYKQAWTRLENKSDIFEPEEYGLLYYYLQTRDDCISNHIQQLEWNEQVSIGKLKSLLQNKVIEIMEQNFTDHELDVLAVNREAAQIDCIYQNFKYESDLAKFLNSLHSEIAIISNKSHNSSSPPQSYNPHKPQILTKKSSDSKLLDKDKKKSVRKYSDQNQEASSPKQSSFSHAKTNEQPFMNLQILHNFWNDEFVEMIEHCNFTEEKRQEYLKQAFKQGNPSVYSWINSFVQGKLGFIDPSELKRSLKIKDQENKYIMRLLPIFSQILKSFVEQGRITDKMRKWSVIELMELNSCILSALELYIKYKNVDDFIENLTLAYEIQNHDMQFYRNYLKRIQDILKQMSGHDEVSLAIFKLYPKQIKSICELYLINSDIEELLDSLDALHKVESSRRRIKVATLNFSGINTNPFEYFDGSEEVEKISNNMMQILQTEKNNLNVQLHIIDKSYCTNKMSVRFGDQVAEEQFLIDFDQFSQKWKIAYERDRPNGMEGDTEDIRWASLLFDYYCYLSVVAQVYNKQISNVDNQRNLNRVSKFYFIEGIKTLPSLKLREFLHLKHSRPASKIDIKYQYVMQYFMKNNLDILFIQEGNQVEWGDELIHEYGWVRGGKSSVILYRKSKFGEARNDLLEKYGSRLNFNNDTAVYFGDRGYLLLSIHLKSNNENLKQAVEVFKTLEQIYDEHPLIKIIIGTDANHFIGGCESNFLNFAPKTIEEVTSNKMRTHVQVQFKKARQQSKSGKDYILTNLEIKDYQIQKINGEIAGEGDLLPSDEHPYDHFIVSAEM